MEKIAIIKLSADNVKLSLIDVSPNGYYNLFDEVDENVKLGISIEQTGLIKPAIVTEALNILKLYRKICDANNVCKVYAVAESFIKVAKNQKSFFDEIYNNTGFSFYIYSLDEEVKLVYRGISNLIDISKAIGVYISPNQTHIMQFNRRTIVHVQTIEYGYLNLAEKYADVTVPEEKCEKMVKEIEFLIKNNDFINNIEQETTFIGAGSVFESLGKLSRKVSKYPLDLENNYIVSKESLDAVYNIVKTLDLDKTKKLKGISEERADALASGLSIIKAVTNYCKMPAISVCSGAFDEGVTIQAMPQEIQERSVPTDMLTNSLETIRTFYDRELSNTANVYNLAILLFKQLKVIHKLSRAYIKPLRIAASMYNCGTRIAFDNYAAKSFEIILNSNIKGVSQKDILIAAFACKCQDTDNFVLADLMKYSSILTEEDYDAIRKLGVIIELACAMDKSRMGSITDITCDILGDSIIMKTITKDDASFDIMQAQKVVPDFKKVFKKVLQVI
ncbi:MAG: hypothetical protein SOV27_01895 [Eubacteriales bacterium]|nr:hypothetical protein [Eubacteriales bacterium]